MVASIYTDKFWETYCDYMGDIVAYYDEYTQKWNFGVRGWCIKNGHKKLVLVRDSEWAKENLGKK